MEIIIARETDLPNPAAASMKEEGEDSEKPGPRLKRLPLSAIKSNSKTVHRTVVGKAASRLSGAKPDSGSDGPC